MGYHLIVAAAGIAALLAGWLAVQRLSAAGALAPDPGAAAQGTGCAGCVRCAPAPPEAGPGAQPARARDAPPESDRRPSTLRAHAHPAAEDVPS